jgi:hypothetical protein
MTRFHQFGPGVSVNLFLRLPYATAMDDNDIDMGQPLAADTAQASTSASKDKTASMRHAYSVRITSGGQMKTFVSTALNLLKVFSRSLLVY